MVRTAVVALVFLSTGAQAQLTSTNCINMGAGMVHCDTVGGSSHYADQDWSGVFQKIHDRHVQRKLGKMIAAGDCQAAFNYAVQESMELARDVQQLCVPR